jgi:hypothetical protein
MGNWVRLLIIPRIWGWQSKVMEKKPLSQSPPNVVECAKIHAPFD